MPLMKTKGFTFLELLMVVVLLAILASVAVPSFTNMLERAKVQDAETTLNVIYQAQRVYRLDHRTYTSLQQLVDAGYLPNPNPNQNWLFLTVDSAATVFTAQATRTGGRYNQSCLKINERERRCHNGSFPSAVVLGIPQCNTDCGASEPGAPAPPPPT